jgi:hypothetical protein
VGEASTAIRVPGAEHELHSTVEAIAGVCIPRPFTSVDTHRSPIPPVGESELQVVLSLLLYLYYLLPA